MKKFKFTFSPIYYGTIPPKPIIVEAKDKYEAYDKIAESDESWRWHCKEIK
jgi:hypothetical protein